jgi:SEC-C motif-containing protein
MRYYRLVITDPPLPAVGRNDPCPCGSGLKFKKCHADKKPRQRTVSLDFGRSVDPNDVRVSPRGAVTIGRFGLPFIATGAQTEESYETKDGPKVLYRFPYSTQQAGTNPNVLLERYAHVFAIDTGTKTGADGHALSVATAVGCKLTVQDGGLLAQPFLIGSWHGRDVPDPEKSGWQLFLHLLQGHPEIHERDRIALIVDHDLNGLDGYNRRTVPILEGFFLPPNVDLIYAAEKGTTFVGSRLVRMCDTESGAELRRLLREASAA